VEACVNVEWSNGPIEPVLGERDVHVWRASLDRDAEDLASFHSLLSADERTRAARFVFPRDANRFIATRGILRSLVARYVPRWTASAVVFTYGPQGKPAAQLDPADCPVRFNLSHANALAIFAFTRGRDVGIDLEAIARKVAYDEVAQRFFSAAEVTELRALPEEHRAEGFYLCWTRKEAYVKALGTGITHPLDRFAVSLTPGMPERLVSDDASRWTLRSLVPTPGYVGALVVEGPECVLQCWRYP
jgi:4'-phosphopantetheinyl transferase